MHGWHDILNRRLDISEKKQSAGQKAVNLLLNIE